MRKRIQLSTTFSFESNRFLWGFVLSPSMLFQASVPFWKYACLPLLGGAEVWCRKHWKTHHSGIQNKYQLSDICIPITAVIHFIRLSAILSEIFSLTWSPIHFLNHLSSLGHEVGTIPWIQTNSNVLCCSCLLSNHQHLFFSREQKPFKMCHTFYKFLVFFLLYFYDNVP